MNVNDIKGFDTMSTNAKALFIRVYAKHRAAVEDKADWTAIKVKEKKDHVEVYFKNKKWLRFMSNGTWY